MVTSRSARPAAGPARACDASGSPALKRDAKTRPRASSRRAALRSRRGPPTRALKSALRLRLRRHLLPGYYPTPLRSPRSASAPNGCYGFRGLKLSGREDLNLRPFGPEPNALPGCATPRYVEWGSCQSYGGVNDSTCRAGQSTSISARRAGRGAQDVEHEQQRRGQQNGGRAGAGGSRGGRGRGRELAGSLTTRPPVRAAAAASSAGPSAVGGAPPGPRAGAGAARGRRAGPGGRSPRRSGRVPGAQRRRNSSAPASMSGRKLAS